MDMYLSINVVVIVERMYEYQYSNNCNVWVVIIGQNGSLIVSLLRKYCIISAQPALAAYVKMLNAIYLLIWHISY